MFNFSLTQPKAPLQRHSLSIAYDVACISFGGRRFRRTFANVRRVDTIKS